MMSRLAPVLAVFFATLVASCGSDWRVTAVVVEPLTLTAGSAEEWHVRVETEPGATALEPALLGISVVGPAGVVVPELFETMWFEIEDSGTWGDDAARDWVFERRGTHPFLENVPPGDYTLHIGGPPEGDPDQHVEVHVTILPPP